MSGFQVVIPSRFGASRLPGKPLRDIAGKPLIQHVWERAQETGAAGICIATDDDRIAAAAKGFGADVCMTDPNHPSGSDRCAEVAEKQGWDDDTVLVNLQGDEPLMPPELVVAVAEGLLSNPEAAIATAATPCTTDELDDANAVKVVCDQNGMALYFSRAPIPWSREQGGADAQLALRHVGLYAYRVGSLRRITAEPPAAIELAESLEQLRALALGYRIHVSLTAERPPAGVDTPEDLARIEALLSR